MKRKFLAECIGTMVLVLMGCGAAVMNTGGPHWAAWVVAVALVFGLSVLTMCYTIGGISGCHINPAITLGVWANGRMKGKEAVGYMISQVIGGFIGAAILYVLVSGGLHTGGVTTTGANGYAEGMAFPAFIAEMVFTFIFVFVVLGTTAGENPSPKFAGLAIGLTLTLIHIVCIPITGTSVNPARSIAPAVFEGGTALAQLWLFILAPFAGGLIAAFVWKGLNCKCLTENKCCTNK